MRCGLLQLLPVAWALSLAGWAAAASRPSVPAPFVAVTPPEVVQGRTARVDLRAPDGDAAAGTAAGQALVLFRTPGGYRAFVGTSPSTPPGLLVVRLRVRSAGRWHFLRATVRVKAGTFGVRTLSVPPALLDPALAAYERRRVLAATSAPLPQPLWDGPFQLPVRGPVSSPYGVRSVYNHQPRGHHLGVDLRAPAGEPVRAAQHGVVVLAEPLPLGGNTVILDHGGGVFTAYLHLAAAVVRTGQKVRAGQPVGYVGSTGLSTAPHLHWAVRVNGVPVDPLGWAIQTRLPVP